MVEPQTLRTEEEFRQWLVNRLSRYLLRPEEEISQDVPFPQYGLDSVAALSLFGDIEDEFGFYLEPTVVWDHPTVDELAAFVLAEAKARRNPGGGE